MRSSLTRSQIPDGRAAGEPVVLDIPSSARPAAPVVLDAVPLLRWEAVPEPAEPFAWRQVRRSGVRVWLARPWFSSGDGELLGVLVFDPQEWVKAATVRGRRSPRRSRLPTAPPACGRPTRSSQHGGGTSDPTVPPLLTFDQLVLDVVEASVGRDVGHRPPLGGQVLGGRDRGWPDEPGNPVAVAGSVALRDVRGQPAVRVLGYRPEYDEVSDRWFVDIALQETPALWPFVRLAVARYPAEFHRGLLAVARRVDQLGAAAANPDAHRESTGRDARPGDIDRSGQLAAVGPAVQPKPERPES